MKIEQNKSLKDLNTFGIDVNAQLFANINSQEQLVSIIKENNEKELFILSGGSNMLLTKDIDALVLHIMIKGITEKMASPDSIYVTANAGENWHDFVQHCIKKNYGGIENLSLIPGYVGSAPIQNIGAYGVELKDTFVSCTAIHKTTAEEKVFTKEDCNFGYRNSIFKNDLKGIYIITQVTFELTTQFHKLNYSYGAIESELQERNIKNPVIKDIADAVIKIRKSKLPDPQVLGNSGSFFKNPIITKKLFKTLQHKYPEIPHYVLNEETIKVPAGWLIEKAGFKGKKIGKAGMHSKQALVLVNYGNATGKDLLEVARKVQETVKNMFNIALEAEVNVL